MKKPTKAEAVAYQEPPDGGWGWLIVIGGMYCLAMWGGIMRCYSVFFSPMMAEFEVEYGTVAWLTGMFQISYGIFTCIGPVAMKRFKHRPMSMLAAVICGISTFLASFCQQLWQVQVLLGLVIGACVGILSITVFTVTTRYFKRRLHTANQLLCMGVSAGPLILCPGYQYLVNMYGWRGACQIMAGLFLNMAAAGALLRSIKLEHDYEAYDDGARERKRRKRSSASMENVGIQKPTDRDLTTLRADIVGSQSIGLYTPTLNRKTLDNNASNCNRTSQNESILDVEHTAAPPGNDISTGLLPQAPLEFEKGFCERLVAFLKKYDLYLFTDRLFYLYTISWTSFAAAYYSAFTYIIPYGEKEMGLTQLQASTLVSAFSAGEIFSRIAYALFFDRIPQRFRLLYITILYAVFTLAVLIFPFVPGYIGPMICCTCIGALGGGTDGIFSAFIAEIFSVQRYPSVFGYGNIISHSTGTVTTVLVGVAVDRFDNLAVPFYIGSCTAALSSALCYVMHSETRERGQRQTNGEQ